jgi:carboxypeptidase Taq
MIPDTPTEGARGLNQSDALSKLREIDGEVQLLTHTAGVLSWDQETYMPDGAVNERAKQLALLEALVHDKTTSDEVGEALEALGASDEQPMGDSSLNDEDRRFVRQVHREYARSVRLPRELVQDFAESGSKSQAAWSKAREADDYEAFVPHLRHLVELNREMAERIGYAEHPYDALLDEYEPFMKTSTVDSVFGRLQEDLVELVGEIGQQPQVDDSFLHKPYPVETQKRFADRILELLSYDTNRGRLDVSAHPFTESLGPNDVRITTRYNERYLPTGMFATVHETGHALYELGVAERYHGTILGTGTSLGIHESQSRMWENMISRSLPFWRGFYPRLQELFPEQLGSVDRDQFYRAINKVQPSFIRIDADEVTYSLHIILRFNLEKRIISDDLQVEDIPDAWQEESKRLFGIAPESYAQGPLQDIHWSFGAFGYFPTYALGNLYGAQFLSTMEKEIPELWDNVEQGAFERILGWLRRNVHEPGSSMTAQELLQAATGAPLSPQHFVDYLRRKYEPIYGLS